MAERRFGTKEINILRGKYENILKGRRILDPGSKTSIDDFYALDAKDIKNDDIPNELGLLLISKYELKYFSIGVGYLRDSDIQLVVKTDESHVVFMAIGNDVRSKLIPLANVLNKK